LQRHTIDVFAKQIDESAADEIPCCIASWINEDKNGQFLTIEISPKYVKREYRVTEGRNLSWLLGEPEDA
jgi:hypothetical protein